jgi:pyruvate dehydrogenase E1 component alpha subunit
VTESYRLEGHYAGEPEDYRGKKEDQKYRKKDPILRFRTHLLGKAGVEESELDTIHSEIQAEMKDAVRFAQESPQPDPGTWMDYIYA